MKNCIYIYIYIYICCKLIICYLLIIHCRYFCRFSNDNDNEITLFRHMFITYRIYFYLYIRVINVSNQNIYVPRRPY